MPRFRRNRTKPSVITLADRARDTGQWERAAEYYREALRRNAQNPPIWVQYGHVLKETGYLAEAEKAYRTALAYDPRIADSHVQLGHVLKIQGKKEEARAAYLRAFALDPSLGGAPFELAGLGWSDAHFSELRGMLRSGVSHPPIPAPENCTLDRDATAAVRTAGHSDDSEICQDRPNVSAAMLEPANVVNGTQDYADWIKLYDTIDDDDREAIAAAIGKMIDPPLISVVVPVYETPERYLRAAIDSVRQQLYPRWELCIADDASTAPHLRSVLERYRAIDPRIKVCYRNENGHISAASNSALTLAEGSFVALLDHDDVLPEHALYVVAAVLDADPEIDLIYSDEDKIDANGWRFDPYFKSDWNPDLMLSQNMFCHLGVYRRSLIEKIGGFRCGFEGSQDYDLVLRALSLTTPNRIRHIPHILYHWRAIPSSVALCPGVKAYAVDRARRAITDHLAERGIAAQVSSSPHPAFNRVCYSLPEPASRVTIVIPTRDRVDLLRTCVEGLLYRTDYPDLEILIVDNQSKEPATQVYLDQLSGDPRIRILSYDAPFNYSAINNFAVARATGSLLCLLNNDVEVITRDWLAEMASNALRPGIGAVGALLYYPDGRIQHAGVIVGLGGVAWHAHHGLRRGDFGYFGRAAVAQNLSAVTAACLVMPKAVFDEVGGFNEKDLSVAFNDVDLCLRIREAGYRIVWTPHAELYHHESASRGLDTDPDKIQRANAEIGYMLRRWSHILDHDPYYNPNLRLKGDAFRLAFPPRIDRPWRRGGLEQLVPASDPPSVARVNGSSAVAPAESEDAQLISSVPVPDLFELRGLKPRGSIAVVLHLYYPDLWNEMRIAIERIPQPFDLFVSVVKDTSDHMRTLVAQAFPNAYIFEFENRGRDIGPFLVLLQSGVLFRYDLVCKLHTKRSLHEQDGDVWRRALIDGVLGSSRQINQIVSSFRSDPDLGMVVADRNIYRAYEHWAGNEKVLAELLPRVGISPDVKDRSFPGGSIFWIRPFVLRALLGAGISLNDFEPEPLQRDGALAHAVERMFGLICEDAGMRVVEHGGLTEPVHHHSHRSSRVYVIAYYLPQFHPIPENDEWWGAGFTEWANVTRAKPLFRGHRQPRLPADLGFYDLRLPEVREAQALLARRYGLAAFCYYYYWFNGRRVLERPLDEMLVSGKPDFPFMICWANEPWTRNWDGVNSGVLLPQTYEPGWATRFARDVAPLLRDQRYFRIGGKPMLLIYRIAHIPEAALAIRELRVALQEEDVPEVHLAAAWVLFTDDGDLPADPSIFGLDAYFEFPPHMVAAQPLRSLPSGLREGFQGKLFDYNRTVTAALAKLHEPITGRRHRCVMGGFDNAARKPGSCHVYHGATPTNFRRWLRGTILHERHQPGERVVFVNAWNEWAEGTYLEPDRDFGCGWLEAVASAAEVQWANSRTVGAQAGAHAATSQHWVASERASESACQSHVWLGS